MVVRCLEAPASVASIRQGVPREAVHIELAHLESADLPDWEPHEEMKAKRMMTVLKRRVMSLDRMMEAADHLPSLVILYQRKYVDAQCLKVASL